MSNVCATGNGVVEFYIVNKKENYHDKSCDCNETYGGKECLYQ